MAITSNTRLTQTEVNNIAQQHDNVADAIVRQQGLLDSNVNNLVAQNSGALITTLSSVHQGWDSTVSDVVTQLRNMAQDMRTAATQLGVEDTNNAQQVRTAGAFHGYLG